MKHHVEAKREATPPTPRLWLARREEARELLRSVAKDGDKLAEHAWKILASVLDDDVRLVVREDDD